MRKIVTKKKIIAGLTVGLLSASGVVGYAFWTGTGTGTGTATTATTGGTVTVDQTTVVPALAPGDTAPLAGTLSNAGTGAVQVTALTATVTVANATGVTGVCDPADFVVAITTALPVTVPAAAAAVPGTAAWAGTLAFTDTAVDQNACKGAAITIHYVAA